MVEENTIVGNTAFEGGGIRFCFFGGTIAEPSICGNAIFDNQAMYRGGGVAVLDADPIIVSCTIDGNGADYYGGGIYAGRSGAGSVLGPTIMNTIVANSTSGGGIVRDDVPLATSYCDVWGNNGGDYLNCEPAPTDMSADPLYCDPPGRDLTLRDDSPCLPDNNPWNALIGAYGAGGCGTSVDGEHPVEESFRLHPPYPNPSSGSVVLSYSVANPNTSVELTILSAGGRVVRSFGTTPTASGDQRLVWDGTDDAGRPVASGAYLVKASTEARSLYRGLVILRRR